MTLTASEALSKLLRMPETVKLPPSREWVYFLEAPTLSPIVVKIGKAQELRFRVQTVQYGCPVPLRLIAAFSAPAGTEKVIHAKFKHLRNFGEWFVLDDQLRQFATTLPRGSMLPNGVAQSWVTETGVPLLPRKRLRKGVHMHGDEYQTSLHWSREHSRP